MTWNDTEQYTVYKHTNKINGKIYIGITFRKPELRWRNGSGYIANKHFYNAIKKYGWDEGFKHEIVATNLSKEDAEKLEIELIQKYNSTNQTYGYNINLGGHSLGQHSEETRKKISKAQYKKVFQYDRFTGKFIRAFQSTIEAEAFLNIPNSDISSVCLKKMKTSHNFVFRYEDDNYKFGKTLSKEELELINSNVSKTMVGKYDLDNNLIQTFTMVKDAIKDAKASRSTFNKVLNSQKIYNGFIWKRIDNLEANNFKKLYKKKRNVVDNVIQYSSETGEILNIFDNIEQAESITSVNRKYIMKSCKNENSTAGGYIWRYSNKGEYEESVNVSKNKHIKKKISQFSVTGEYLETYESITIAAKKYNVNISAISNCIRGKSETSCGYIWKYA